MSDFFHANTNDLSNDDINELIQIASTHRLEGEEVIEIRKTGTDEVQINVGTLVNRRSGSGRKITAARIVETWTVMKVEGWIA